MTASGVIRSNLKSVSKSPLKLFYSFAASALLLVLACRNLLMLYRGTSAHHIEICVFFVMFAVISVFALLSARDFSANAFFLLMPVAMSAIFIRALLFDHTTQDYNYFLSGWVRFFYENGGFKALKDSVGDYNMPYLYFLAFLSYLKMPDLYGIKLLSIAFDFLLAFYSMKLSHLLCRRRVLSGVVFTAVLLIPTVFLNGACWGQCDSIYAAFIVMSLYYALSNHPLKSIAMLALAFAFKLQTVFIIPLYLVLLFTRRIKVRHLFVFPVIFLAALLPAVMLGKPLKDTLVIYLNQTETYKDYLTLNAPSVFALIPKQDGPVVQALARLGITLTAAFVILLCMYLFTRRKALYPRLLFTSALLFATAIPLLLPHMHDRYFFLADVLSVLYAFMRPNRIIIPLLTITASYGAYHTYLLLENPYPLKLGTIMLCLSVLVLLFDLISSQKKKYLM